MKKIGILTFARVANFGANLQGLSTYCYLKKNGFDPIIIDWEPEDFAVRQNREYETIQGKAHFDFIDKMCKKTKKCRDDSDIVEVIREERIMGVIIGSDAVLQHHPFMSRIKFPTKHLFYLASTDSARMFPNPFWGTFIYKMKDRIPVIMMSVSSQNSPYIYFSKKVKGEMAKCLYQMAYISVRDNWTGEMIINITRGGIRPTITPDPVFAFNINCAEFIPTKDEILTRYSLPSKYILLSFLNNQTIPSKWLDEFKAITVRKGISCVALPMPDGIKFCHRFDYEIPCPLSPLDWYSLIKYSLGYVGQNMHPVVVALHNAVPVYSFDSYGVTKYFDFKCQDSSSKIYHILKEFGCVKNRTAVNIRRYSLPNPEVVMDKIINCSKESLNDCSVAKYQDYLRMMDKISQIFN